MGLWYRTGTVDVTNGIPGILGHSTLWLTQASVGDIFNGPDGVEYELTSVTDDTHAEIKQKLGTAAYAGTTLTAQDYSIVRNFTSTLPAELASKLAAMITAWHLTTDEFTAWLSGTGDVTVHDSIGNAYSLATPAALAGPTSGRLSKSVAGGVTVTLTATEANNLFFEFTGVLTANVPVVVPGAARSFFILNSTTGAYTLTVKTAAGTGIVVPQGGRALLECDATNVLSPLSSLPVIAVGKILTALKTLTLDGTDGTTMTFPATSATLARTDAGNMFSGNQEVLGNVVVRGTINTGTVNDIGTPGARAFGVGICPAVPPGMMGMLGFADQASDNYGNYQYSDGSIMYWRPAFYFKWGTGANGLAINAVDIKPFSYFANVAAANAAGYALHRSFYDGGAVQLGYFRDKYIPSNNGGIASSLRNGIVLTSTQRGGIVNTAFATLTGAPGNTLGGAIAAAKTRGANFFPESAFIQHAAALISYAHGQASSTTTYCAWYDATNNFPKGNNNNALGDAQDAAILYLADGNGTYPGCGKTGSANLFSRTTDNGQNCGGCDDNGLVYKFTPGITSDGTNYYLLNASVAMKNVTGGNTLATDLFGATGLAAMYTNIGATYGAITASGGWKYVGNAAQVFSEATSGNAWAMACAGIPLVGGTGGTNPFGNDGLYDPTPRVNEMALMSGSYWADSSYAGVFCRHLGNARSLSDASIGFRSALYL